MMKRKINIRLVISEIIDSFLLFRFSSKQYQRIKILVINPKKKRRPIGTIIIPTIGFESSPILSNTSAAVIFIRMKITDEKLIQLSFLFCCKSNE